MTYTTPLVEGNFRSGKHDFWVVGTIFDESETVSVGASFEFEDEIISFGTDFDSSLEITDVNFRYGYSFKTFDFTVASLIDPSQVGVCHDVIVKLH